MATLTDDDRNELLLSCRYGDLEDVQQFVEKFGPEALAGVRDENGNTVLHMICGNGHTDLLDYILPIIPASVLSEQNSAQSTPLHWAAVNSHLPSVQKLVQFPGGPGKDLIDIKNAAGHSPLAEAELAGWDEGATWLVEVMNLEGMKEEAGDAAEESEVGASESEPPQDIEVEIEDADGQIAKMTISGGGEAKS